MEKQDFYNDDFINITGNLIHKTAIVYPEVRMGIGNRIGAYAVIGSVGEVRGTKLEDFQGIVEIGSGNVISEHVTIQRPMDWEAKTKIGNQNLIMAHCHIGHDAEIGDSVEIGTGTVIGGYTKILDGAKIKLNCTVRNRLTIGENSIVGMGSVVVKNVENETVVFGNPAKRKEK